MAETDSRLLLATASYDVMTGRVLASFSGADGNMLTVNSAMSPTGDDPAAAIRAGLAKILRDAADALDPSPAPED